MAERLPNEATVGIEARPKDIPDHIVSDVALAEDEIAMAAMLHESEVDIVLHKHTKQP